MTEREEIDVLRRLVADLTERVRALEARPTPSLYAPIGLVPSLPAAPWWQSPVIGGTGPRTGDALPFQPISTCTGPVTLADAPTQSWGLSS